MTIIGNPVSDTMRHDDLSGKKSDSIVMNSVNIDCGDLCSCEPHVSLQALINVRLQSYFREEQSKQSHIHGKNHKDIQMKYTYLAIDQNKFNSHQMKSRMKGSVVRHIHPWVATRPDVNTWSFTWTRF